MYLTYQTFRMLHDPAPDGPPHRRGAEQDRQKRFAVSHHREDEGDA